MRVRATVADPPSRSEKHPSGKGLARPTLLLDRSPPPFSRPAIKQFFARMDKNFSIDVLLQSSTLNKFTEDPHKRHDSPLPSRSGCFSESVTLLNTQTCVPVSTASGSSANNHWYNPVNYINLTQQLAAQMIQASHPGGVPPGQMAPPSGLL
ncbi:hypothetical protein ANCCAN_03950 [Ancylostoma caninum]|uniref:Uncharacterized protein n=1 Tax=Ancylostoma caninum TaxID=29170 RepID=A0A368GZZ9_ANCCA|nr:hypothetical protein ANCCAN_03950 [Ancylostoma caninum]